MKKLLLAGLLALGASAHGQIAHWDFNANTNDQTGNGMNGTATNCTYVSGVNGLPNTAIKFNGTNSMVDVPYHALTSTPTYTIQALVRVDGFYSGLCEGSSIFMQESPGGDDRKMLLVTDNMYNPCGVYNPSQMRFQCAAAGTNPNPITAGQYSPGITVGQWYCVTTTYDANMLRLYVDGVLKLSMFYPNQFIAGTAPISIGYFATGLPGGYPYYFDGAIDDIKLWDYALTPGMVVAQCDTSKMPPCSVDDIKYCSSLSNAFTYDFTPAITPTNNNVIWNFGDGSPQLVAMGTQTVTHTYPGGGTYKICLQVLDAQGKVCTTRCFEMCMNNQSGAKMTSPNSGHSNSIPVRINAAEPYPNPAGLVLNVPVMGKSDSHVQVTIYSLEGKLLRTETADHEGAGIIQIRTADLTPGSYLVEINDATGRQVKPFTKL